MALFKFGDALKQFVQDNTKIKKGIQHAQIETVWEEIMGKTISKYTDKIYVFNQKLFIQTSIGPLKNELGFQKEQIVQRVNEKMGDQFITDVVIQ